ncbi:MAG: hypothetical protein KGQ93_11200 [Cyanobacteria bacterium REEB459]|nr:hypothetical protein [Cyanobacteria bacterium REEB459]
MVQGKWSRLAGEATAFALGGAGTGAIASALFGNMGVALGSAAFALGAAPVMVAWAIVGLAAFGLKQTMAE